MPRSAAMALSVFLTVVVGCGGTSTGPAGKGSGPQPKAGGAGKGESKLVGTWQFVRSSSGQRPDWGETLTFTADGKVVMRGPSYANDGTYSLDKDTLKMDAAPLHETFTVTKLTDKDLFLELHQPGGRPTFEYRRK